MYVLLLALCAALSFIMLVETIVRAARNEYYLGTMTIGVLAFIALNILHIW